MTHGISSCMDHYYFSDQFDIKYAKTFLKPLCPHPSGQIAILILISIVIYLLFSLYIILYNIKSNNSNVLA